ncbi:ribonuclease P protein subunit [Candidatus Woesearchaeota archaeon]|nr:ribonuclease P protein subunit [Candidatus Woesearchaeota archaeon]
MTMIKIYPHELIGKTIKVTDSKNKHDLEISGKVVDETKMTLVVDHKGKSKTLLKKNITFVLQGSNEEIIGKDILRRPEERIKGR